MRGRSLLRWAFLTVVLVVSVVALGSKAGQKETIYGIADFGIYSIDPSTAAGTLITAASPFPQADGTIQAGAQRASDGLIYFLLGKSGNQQVWTFNPSTLALNEIGTTGYANTIPRLAFTAYGNDVLYAMYNTNVYVIDQSTGVASTPTAPVPSTISGAPTGGGDLAIDYAGNMYISSGTSMYIVPNFLTGGSTATKMTISGSVPSKSLTGLAFGPNGNFYAVDSNAPSDLWEFACTSNPCTTVNGTDIGSTGAGTYNFGDLASTIAPDLEITKTAQGGGPFYIGEIGTYTLSVDNYGSAPTTHTMTVTDVLPTGLTYYGATGTGWTCGASGQTVTCTNPQQIGPSPAYSPSAPPITLNVQVDGSASNPTINSASVQATPDVPPVYSSDNTGVSSVVVTTPAPNGTVLYIGPYDSTDATYGGAADTGSYDGVVTPSNNYDFTARGIPLSGYDAMNQSATPASPSGLPFTTTSQIVFSVPNAVYYDKTSNGWSATTFTVNPPLGWTAQVCEDSTCTATLTSKTSCGSRPKQNGFFLIGGTFTYCSGYGYTPQFTEFYVQYTIPSGTSITPFSRYDSLVTASDGVNSNSTHNELYGGYLLVTKLTPTIIAANCPGAYTSGQVCPGGIIQYGLDFRNIVAGGGLGTEGTLQAAFPVAQSITISDAGSGALTPSGGSTPLPSEDWQAYSGGLLTNWYAGAASSASCGVYSGGSYGHCGDSTGLTTACSSFVMGATSFSCALTESLYPQNVASTWQGVLYFAVKVK